MFNMTAADAHDIADGRLREKFEEELTIVGNAISKEVANGKCKTTVFQWVSDAVVGYLQGLGYSVKRDSCQRDGSWTDITW